MHQTAISAIPVDSCHCRDISVSPNFAHKAITIINPQIPGRINRHAGREVQFGTGGGLAIPRKACLSVSGYSRDDAGGGNLANHTIPLIGDEDIARAVNRNGYRVLKLRAGGAAVVAGVSGSAVAGNSGDDSRGVDHPYAVASHFGNVQIPCSIDG
jgi:uncharacterized protein with ACT and thioredoxin-like domain